jgi:hypothetical protein
MLAHEFAEGTRVRRLTDGQQAVIGTDTFGKRRALYRLHGQDHVAPAADQWEPAAPPLLPLLPEEAIQVARAADSKLRAIRLHQPDRWWETRDVAFDPELVRLILEHLSR